MPGNSFGYLFRLTTFGESHGKATGGVIDGCPAGLSIDIDFIHKELDRRKPVYPGSTPRKEPDRVEFLSGIIDGRTSGAPIGFLIKNIDAQTSEYNDISNLYRPSHADYTYHKKYGTAGAGGGRASGRETVARVVAGAIAKLLLKISGIEINAFVSQVGDISEAEASGDTLGGTVTCRVKGVPVGLGEPVFDKLHADLGKAMLSIGSAKAFEYGLGFQAASMKGSEYNDQMTVKNEKIIFLTNHDGGIQGGISNGEDIIFPRGI